MGPTTTPSGKLSATYEAAATSATGNAAFQPVKSSARLERINITVERSVLREHTFPGPLIGFRNYGKHLTDRVNFVPGREQLSHIEVRSMQPISSVAEETETADDLLEAAFHNPKTLGQGVQQQQDASSPHTPVQEQQAHEELIDIAHPPHHLPPAGQRDTADVDRRKYGHPSLVPPREIDQTEDHGEELGGVNRDHHMTDASRTMRHELYDEQQLHEARMRAQREENYRLQAIANNRFDGLGTSGTSKNIGWKALKRGVKGHIHRLGTKIAEATEPQHDRVGVDGTHPSMSSASRISSVNRGRPLPKIKKGAATDTSRHRPVDHVSATADEEVDRDLANTSNDYGTAKSTPSFPRRLRQFFSIRNRCRPPLSPVPESDMDDNADTSDNDHRPDVGPEVTNPDVTPASITTPQDGEDCRPENRPEGQRPEEVTRSESWSPLD